MKDQPKCALITGASQGLGRALAEECAGRGMDLVLVALPDTGLPEVVRILRAAYAVRIEAIETDLTAADSPLRVVETAVQKGFEIDALINNAGVGFNSRFGDSTFRQNDITIELNVGAVARLTRLMLPVLEAREKAWILNVASLGAYFPMPSMPVYSSTKSFVLSFSLVLREEMRGSRIGVSVLCPNGIRTNSACRKLIESQGWAGRATCQYPDQVARAALHGLFRGKAVIVPGLVNKILRRISLFVPRSLYMRMISRRWGTEKKTPAERSARAIDASTLAAEA